MSLKHRLKQVTNAEAMDSDTTDSSEQKDLRELSEDVKRLNQQQEEAKCMSLYIRNRFIFLIQSFLLGLTYSMVWPTLWLYLRDGFYLGLTLTKFFYGITFISYPMASMLSAHLVKNIQCSTKNTILILNMFEIIGNIIYTLHYHPLLPVCGRLIAGLGDAFYVVLMKETKTKYGNQDKEQMTMECLAAFILGVILSPGINIITTFIPFHIGNWHLTQMNYPGLTMAVLFLVMQFVILFFLNIPEEDGVIKQVCESTKHFPDILNNIVYQSRLKAAFTASFAFVYTYVAAHFELMLPIILYEKFETNGISAMLVYAVIGTLYAMFLLMTMAVSFDHQLETFFCISSVVQTFGLFSLLYLELSYTSAALSIVSVVVIVLCLTIMWSNDDSLFINFLQRFIPAEERENTHRIRKVMSKLAFVVAGVTVPFCHSVAFKVTIPILIVVVCLLFSAFLVIRVEERRKR